jgi:very-short-patch-repair endonuclease
MDADELIAAIAARQLGLVTREQALEAGVSPRVIERRLARGSLVIVRNGLYRSVFAPETWLQRALSACLGREAKVVVSHEGAGFLHGLTATEPAVLDLIATIDIYRTDHLTRVHRTSLQLRDRAVVRGIPTTSKARTVADLASRLPARRLRELVDSVMVGATSSAERARLRRDLARYAGERRRGSPALRSAVAAWTDERHGSVGIQSVLEAEVLRVLLAGRLPRPVCQHRVQLPSVETVYIDFAWPDERVGLEVDGYRFHAGRQQFDHDRRRGNALLLAGWEILHTTSTEMRRDPKGLIRAVRQRLSGVINHRNGG